MNVAETKIKLNKIKENLVFNKQILRNIVNYIVPKTMNPFKEYREIGSTFKRSLSIDEMGLLDEESIFFEKYCSTTIFANFNKISSLRTRII